MNTPRRKQCSRQPSALGAQRGYALRFNCIAIGRFLASEGRESRTVSGPDVEAREAFGSG